ncbi:MAG: ABC transporter permease subunit [Chloroflexota bacterium]
MTPTKPLPQGHVAVPPWRDIRVLRVLGQLAILGTLALLVAAFGAIFVGNIASTRLTFSLGFLGQTSGMELAQTPISYNSTDTFARAFAVGVINTLLVSAIGVVLATVLGIVVGVARLSNNWLASRISARFVEVMRNTPLLVQLVLIAALMRQLPGVADAIELPGSVFISSRGVYIPRPEAAAGFAPWFALVVASIAAGVALNLVSARRRDAGQRTFALGRAGLAVALGVPVVGWLALSPFAFDLPALNGFNFTGGVAVSTAFTALLIGLVIYTAAFIGEVVRGGIQAVRHGQVEAAYSIGLTRGQTLRLVVFPQALRVIVPPLTSQYLNLIKNSSLAVAVGYADIFLVGRAMANQTSQPLSVILLVMGTYLAISLLVSLVMNAYNRRVQVLER